MGELRPYQSSLLAESISIRITNSSSCISQRKNMKIVTHRNEKQTKEIDLIEKNALTNVWKSERTPEVIHFYFQVVSVWRASEQIQNRLQV